MRCALFFVLSVLALSGPAVSAEPPALVHYQGVLRDATDAPLEGDHDMVFTFFSAETGGDEILVDRHTAGDGNPVNATGGVFNVALGSGVLIDGAGPGTYGSLAEVFRDHGEAWLEIEVGTESLSPRVRVLSAGYALNADHLDGADSAFFVDTSSTVQEKTGLFRATGGVDFGPGASDDLDAAEVATLTSGVNADGLHSHAAVGGSDTLDGLDSSQFLRSDANDTFTSGTLTTAVGTTLSVRGSLRTNGSIYIDEDGPDHNQYLYFYDDGSWVGEALYWDEVDDRFELTNEISVKRYFGTTDPAFYLEPDGFSHLDGLALHSNNLFLNYGGPEFTSRIFFYDDGSPNDESLSWSEGADRFELSDDVFTTGDILAARFADFTDPSYNVDPASISTLNQLELDSGILSMNPDGPETSSEIRFYANGLPDSEWIRWNAASDRFDFSDQVSVAGQLRAYSFADGNNDTYVIDPAASSTLNDLNLNAGYLWLNRDGPDGNSGLRFFNAGSASAEYLQWDDADERFELSDDVYASTMVSTRYYDSGDTSYYVDPNGTSVLNVAQLRGSYAYFNQDGPDGQVSLYFHDDGVATNEWIQWDDVNDFFEFSNDISVRGDLELAGTGATGNLAIDGELEIGRATVDDVITFDGSQTLTWDDSETRFELTNELALLNALQVGSTSSAPVAHSRFGTAAPFSGDMSNTGDVQVTNDIEVGQNAYVSGVVLVGDSSPSSTQAFSSFGQGDGKDEVTISQSDDVYVQGDLELDGSFYAVYRRAGTIYNYANGNQYAMLDNDDNSTTSTYRWHHDGTFTAVDRLAELQEDGDLRIRGTLYENQSFDVAESFLAGEPLEPGNVVRVDPAHPGGVLRTTGPSDAGVVGVVSTDPGVVLGGAPFDADTLRRVWGTAVHEEFLDLLPGLRVEILDTEPQLREEERALRELEAFIDTERATLNAPRGAVASVLPPAGSSEDSVTRTDPMARRFGALEALAREAQDRRTLLDGEIESIALERFCEARLVAVALAGRVPVKVDAAFGAIAPGDPLSPSPVPGIAMRASGSGPVLGIVLEHHDDGRGTALTLVTPGHRAPAEEIASIREDHADLASEVDERTPDPVTGTQSVPGHLQVVLDREADDQARFSIFRDGENALGAEVFRVDEDGNVFAKGAFSPSSMDVAEYFRVSEPVEPGDVLTVDRATRDAYARTSEAGDPGVIGVVAQSPGVLLGRGIERIAATDPALAAELELARTIGDRDAEATLWTALEREFLQTHAPVAMTGTVPVKVDAGFGAIRRGDLLVASPTPGHAMRADDPATGTVLGKALQSLENGIGTIRMLVLLR